MIKEHKKSLHQLLEIFICNNIFEEDDRMFILNQVIISALTPLQQEVFLTYVDTGSLRKTAEYMNCSATTIMNIVKKVKKLIIEKHNRLYKC